VADAREPAQALEPSELTTAPRALARIVFVEALRATLGRVPIWCIAWAIDVVPALLPALAWGVWMSDATAHRYSPGSLFADLGTVFRFDQRRALALLDDANARTGALLAAIAMLAGCFTAGGWLQVFLERTHGQSVRRFFMGGARYFWRFVRVLAVTLASLALIDFLVYGAPWNALVLRGVLHVPSTDYEKLETLTSESTVFALRFAQNALYFALVSLVLVWGDYTRTRLALLDTTSAIWAGLCTWFTLLRHPIRTLAPIAALAAIEVAIAAAAGVFARKIEGDFAQHPDLLGVALLFTVGQLALLWRVVLRGARYHAAAHVSRDVVRPIARPDPWRASFGPPSGPRYPLGGDEFGMSL
jgi:hypothetical protein